MIVDFRNHFTDVRKLKTVHPGDNSIPGLLRCSVPCEISTPYVTLFCCILSLAIARGDFCMMVTPETRRVY